MEKNRLRNFENFERFPESQYHCPQCGTRALEDNWPPNYGSSRSAADAGWVEQLSQKCVCLTCKAAFRVGHYRERKLENMQVVDSNEKITFSELIPLVELNGKWLTPHDVDDEEYKKKHGHYPKVAYG